ncbi:MAG: hypothetical protein ACTSRG_04940 [Candidatus Helarchaeota archaeon]
MEKEQSIKNIQKAKRLPRIRAIETIRGIATFFMVFGHYFVWFITKRDEIARVCLFYVQNFSMNHGFPFFIILIGITQIFAIQRRLDKKFPLIKLTKYILKRGFIIIAMSLIMNTAFYLYSISSYPWLIFDWNIMGMIGLAYIVTAYLGVLKLPKPAYGIIGFALIILDASLPIELQHSIGFHVIAYMVIGTMIGGYLMESVHKDKMKHFSIYLLIIGIVLFGTTLPFDLSIIYRFIDINNPLVFDFIFLASGHYEYYFFIKSSNIVIPMYYDYPWQYNQWIYYLFGIGNFAIIFSILLIIQDIKKKRWRVFRPIMLGGNLSLTAFAAHFLVAGYIFLPFNLYNYFNVFPYTVWGLTMFVFIYIISLFWKRYNYKYSLEWMLRG